MLALALSLALAAPPRTAVMPLVGGDAISDRAAASLTETLANELQKEGSMEVVLPLVRGTLLSPLKPREELACKTDRCMAEVAGALGAERLVTGEVSWDGGKLVLNLRLLEGRSARLLAMSERGFKKGTLNDLLGGLPGMIPELLRGPAAAVTPAHAVAPAAPAKPADPRTPAVQGGAGKFVLHYHHGKGRYAGVQLYTWETFQSGADLTQSVSGYPPDDAAVADPDGKDEFGLYWVIPMAGFRNGRLNFGVRTRGGFACVRVVPETAWSGESLKWLFRDGPEAWLNDPECEMFTTLEDAKRNQRK